MHDLILRRKHILCEREEMGRDDQRHPKFSHATWAAIGVGAAGIATSLYGANRQSQAQDAANASNAASVKESDLNSWKSYLMQRGVDPSGVTQFGQMPTEMRAVNTKLPLWANMTFNTPATQPKAGASMVRLRTTPRI